MKIDKNAKYIVRCSKAGVFFGNIEAIEGSTVEMTNARKLWYWDGAAAIEQMAVEGVKKPQNCMFTIHVPQLIVLNASQIIACSEQAVTSIEGVAEWKV